MSIDLFNKLILKCFWYCNTNLYNFFLIIINQIINHKPFFLLCYSQSQVFISFFAICLSNLLLLLYAFLSVSRSCRRRWFLFFNFSSFSRSYVLCFIFYFSHHLSDFLVIRQLSADFHKLHHSLSQRVDWKHNQKHITVQSSRISLPTGRPFLTSK